MYIELLEQAVRMLAAVCAASAIVDCAATGEQTGNALRWLCGMAAAATILRIVGDNLLKLL